MKQKKVLVQGKGPVTLAAKDYLSAGGEGEIYVKNGQAFKIYLDPKKMIPTGKIRELMTIRSKSVITPDGVILDEKDNPIGYTMRYLPKTVPICQIFPRSFRERNQITNDMILGLISQIRKGIDECHSHNVLIVDMNDMNFLVADRKFDEVFFIDTDSYQTPHYPATAITQTIRDVHAKSFSNDTDWFSFAVISFQLLTGVHPYKGKHPTVRTIDGRMMKNISVLNKDVTIAPTAYDPKSVIPSALMQWYLAVLDSGKRMAPPLDLTGTVVTVTTPVHYVSSDTVTRTEYMSVTGMIVWIRVVEGMTLVMTTNGLHVRDRIPHHMKDIAPYAQVGMTPKYRHIVSAIVGKGGVSLINVRKGNQIKAEFAANSVFAFGTDLYCVTDTSIGVVEYMENDHEITVAYLREIGQASEHGTLVGDGVVVNRLLGACYLSLVDRAMHYELRVPELEKHRIITATRRCNVVVITSECAGVMYSSVIVVSKTYDTYTIRTGEITDNQDISFAVKDNGVCMLINGEGNIELFAADPRDSRVKVVADQSLMGEQLYSDGGSMYSYVGNTVYSLSLK